MPTWKPFTDPMQLRDGVRVRFTYRHGLTHYGVIRDDPTRSTSTPYVCFVITGRENDVPNTFWMLGGGHGREALATPVITRGWAITRYTHSGNLVELATDGVVITEVSSPFRTLPNGLEIPDE